MSVKTLTCNLRKLEYCTGVECSYRGKKFITSTDNMYDIEQEAKEKGFTHILWKGIPIGKGWERCKIK